jgi:Reverse transcriptase (RNA-dependent DNA polymerase)
MTTREAEVPVEISGAGPEGSGRKPPEQGGGVSNGTATREPSWTGAERGLMEDVVSRPNMMAALEREEANQGAPGIDRMTTGELRSFLKEGWPAIREELLEGTYRPQPVLEVEIEKPHGGVRTLGIPTVCDRLLQQAVHQVLMPLFHPDFSDSSYGYRPGQNAWQAVRAARWHVADGKRWVVGLDLKKFFDRVNHDILMAWVARKVEDKRVLLLIRWYPQAGVLEGGLVSQRVEGRRRAVPSPPCCRTFCSTSSTRSWRGAVMSSVATPTTATSTCRPGVAACGSWQVSPVSLRSGWHSRSTSPKAALTAPGEGSFWASA